MDQNENVMYFEFIFIT